MQGKGDGTLQKHALSAHFSVYGHGRIISLFRPHPLQEKQGPLQHFHPSPKTWNHEAQTHK